MVLIALLWTLFGSPPPGTPPARVLLLSSPSVPIGPSLRDSARVQLAGVATVGEGPALAGSSLSDRVAEAASLVDRSPATLIVWLEQTQVDGEFVLFAVSRNRERALIQVVRLPAATEAERDRLVAVKIALLVEAALPAVAIALEADGTAPPRAPPPAPDARATSAIVLEAGLEGALMRGDQQTGLLIGIGGRARRSRLTGEVRVAVWQASDRDFAGPTGDVLVDETDISIGARLLSGKQGFAAGVWLDAAVRLLDADGIANDGATGSAIRAVPAFAGGVELRWTPRPEIAFRAAVGVDVAVRPHHFLIDQEEVADTGRWRAVATISTVISIPW